MISIQKMSVKGVAEVNHIIYTWLKNIKFGLFQYVSFGIFRSVGKTYLNAKCSIKSITIPNKSPIPSMINTPATARILNGFGMFKLLSEFSRQGTRPYHFR